MSINWEIEKRYIDNDDGELKAGFSIRYPYPSDIYGKLTRKEFFILYDKNIIDCDKTSQYRNICYEIHRITDYGRMIAEHDEVRDIDV